MHRSKALALLGVAAGVVAAGAPVAASAATPAQPYISLPSVVVTNVGQHPHLTVTYGNRGGTTLNNVAYECHYVVRDGSVDVFARLVYNTYRSPLIPGQNANFEYEGNAFRVSSATTVQCTITGLEAGTGIRRSASSNVATIQVNR
jgi:hypothetical protein